MIVGHQKWSSVDVWSIWWMVWSNYQQLWLNVTWHKEYRKNQPRGERMTYQQTYILWHMHLCQSMCGFGPVPKYLKSVCHSPHPDYLTWLSPVYPASLCLLAKPLIQEDLRYIEVIKNSNHWTNSRIFLRMVALILYVHYIFGRTIIKFLIV